MIEQGSPEWFAARLGRVTASRVSDVVARTKTGPSASRANYMAELVAERLTGVTADSYTSAAMQWGSDHEEEAAILYGFHVGEQVTKCGFVNHPSIEMSGASPDRLVGEHGGAEIKCPNTATHIDTLLGASIPSKYLTQMQWGMACTGRSWWDYVSYDPRLPADMQLFVKRVQRNDDEIARLEREIIQFLRELDQKIEALQQRVSLTKVQLTASLEQING